MLVNSLYQSRFVKIGNEYFTISYYNTIAASFLVIPHVSQKCNTDSIVHGDLFAFISGPCRFFRLGTYLVEFQILIESNRILT